MDEHDDVLFFVVTPEDADAMFPELWSNPERQYVHDIMVFHLGVTPSSPPPR